MDYSEWIYSVPIREWMDFAEGAEWFCGYGDAEEAPQVVQELLIFPFGYWG